MRFTLCLLCLSALLCSCDRLSSSKSHRSEAATPAPSRPASTRAPVPLANTYYAPTENLESIDYRALLRARKSLDIAMYVFTDRYIAQELIDLSAKGVRIRLYRDGDQFDEEQRQRGGNSTTKMLQGFRNIQIRVKPSSRKSLMHLKAWLADGIFLRDGSANWSAAGLKQQDNEARYTTDRKEAQSFRSNFDALWSRPGNRVIQ